MDVQIASSLKDCHHLTRMGNVSDGGYVVCNQDIVDSDFLLSFGVSNDWTFEAAYSELKPKSEIHAYDHTINFQIFVLNSIVSFVKFIKSDLRFQRLFNDVLIPFRYLKFFRYPRTHFKTKVVRHSFSTNEIQIEDIFARVDSDTIFCKIDIEGWEYRIIDKIIQNSDRIVGITIEFHDIVFMFSTFQESLKKLDPHFDLIHVHANNYGFICETLNIPDVMEFTFSKKKRHLEYSNSLKSPVTGLDYPNNTEKPDYEIKIVSQP